MKLSDDDGTPFVLEAIDRLVERHGHTKVFAKIPRRRVDGFLASGFRIEASVPGFYDGTGEAVFLGRYHDPARKEEGRPEVVARVLEASRDQKVDMDGTPIPDGYRSLVATESDVVEIADLYRMVFPSYPFPITEPDYILETMRGHITYFKVTDQDGRIVALSSSEKDLSARNSEMTDFATHPNARGKGLGTHLLHAMESDTREHGILTLYTIARAYSYGMNIVFARNGYTYAGTLTNNTDISGSIESMNIWYRHMDG